MADQKITKTGGKIQTDGGLVNTGSGCCCDTDVCEAANSCTECSTPTPDAWRITHTGITTCGCTDITAPLGGTASFNFDPFNEPAGGEVFQQASCYCRWDNASNTFTNGTTLFIYDDTGCTNSLAIYGLGVSWEYHLEIDSGTVYVWIVSTDYHPSYEIRPLIIFYGSIALNECWKLHTGITNDLVAGDCGDDFTVTPNCGSAKTYMVAGYGGAATIRPCIPCPCEIATPGSYSCGYCLQCTPDEFTFTTADINLNLNCITHDNGTDPDFDAKLAGQNNDLSACIPNANGLDVSALQALPVNYAREQTASAGLCIWTSFTGIGTNTWPNWCGNGLTAGITWYSSSSDLTCSGSNNTPQHNGTLAAYLTRESETLWSFQICSVNAGTYGGTGYDVRTTTPILLFFYGEAEAVAGDCLPETLTFTNDYGVGDIATNIGNPAYGITGKIFGYGGTVTVTRCVEAGI